MPRITLRHNKNKDVSFIHIMNLLVGHRIMTLEEAHSFYKRFKLGEDVVFEIPEDVASQFRIDLDCLNCKHE